MSEFNQPYFGKQALLTYDSSHDSLDSSRFSNWLPNGAGLMCYAHGRTHVEFGYTIHVSDLIHKRGPLMSSDILLMEEQQLLSMGEPLSVPSRLGQLRAMAMLPTMNTANGEGALIAYYDHGVVSFDTFEAPRETRHDGDGVVIQKGWDTKKLVNHLLNSISAVGRYAVAVLPRDHLFRSKRGLHLLSTVIGQGSFNTEQTNRISSDVDPLLEKDPADQLSGSSCGFWMDGDRFFATTGMHEDRDKSSSPMGRGFVAFNQASTFTEDRTPIGVWEGLWTFDSGVSGIHKMNEADWFSLYVSGADGTVYAAIPDKELVEDVRDEEPLPVEWLVETAAAAPAGLSSDCFFNGLSVEFLIGSSTQRVRALCRTNRKGMWEVWKEFSIPDKEPLEGEQLLIQDSCGKPPMGYREGTWMQVRLEGIGPVEIRLIRLDFSPSTTKSGRQRSTVVSTETDDYFVTNKQPISERWPQT